MLSLVPGTDGLWLTDIHSSFQMCQHSVHSAKVEFLSWMILSLGLVMYNIGTHDDGQWQWASASNNLWDNVLTSL